MKLGSTFLPSPSGGRGTAEAVDEDVKHIKIGTESLKLMTQSLYLYSPIQKTKSFRDYFKRIVAYEDTIHIIYKNYNLHTTHTLV